jgi:hypothetical protein
MHTVSYNNNNKGECLNLLLLEDITMPNSSGAHVNVAVFGEVNLASYHVYASLFHRTVVVELQKAPANISRVRVNFLLGGCAMSRDLEDITVPDSLGATIYMAFLGDQHFMVTDIKTLWINCFVLLELQFACLNVVRVGINIGRYCTIYRHTRHC